MNTNDKQKEYTCDLINVLPYIISGLGLLNIIGIFYPLMNISYIYQYIDLNISDNPSLFNIVFCGIMSDSKYRILFIAVSIILFLAVLLSIIFFIITILKRDKGYKLAVIASALFFLFSFSVCSICILCFVSSYNSFDLIDLLAFKFSIIIPERIMEISVANIVLALLIRHDIKHLSSFKLKSSGC